MGGASLLYRSEERVRASLSAASPFMPLVKNHPNRALNQRSNRSRRDKKLKMELAMILRVMP